MADAAIQCLVTSFDHAASAIQVVKDILKKEVGETDDLDSPLYHTWHLSNKYFTADIKLCCCTSEDCMLILDNVKSVEAVVFVCDLNQTSSFQKIKETASSLLQEGSPEVRVLLNTNQALCEDSSREQIFSWCVDNNFELVQSVSEEDADDSFAEKFGVERVIQALNSHVWSNHEIKGAKSTVEEENNLFEDGASFEQLFSQFEIMKEKAKALEGEDRKDYAEKVALAFMEALGIDDDE